MSQSLVNGKPVEVDYGVRKPEVGVEVARLEVESLCIADTHCSFEDVSGRR